MSRMSPFSLLLDTTPTPARANQQMCPATFTRPQHVGRHVRSHTGDRPYECKECPLRFARRYVPHHSNTLPTSPSIHAIPPTFPPFIPNPHLHSIHRPDQGQTVTNLLFLVIFSLDTSTKLIVNKNQEQDPRRKERKEGESQCRLWLVSLISPLGQ